MSIPPKVADRLSAQGIDYQIIEDADISPLHQLCSRDQIDKSQIVQLVILQDSLGRVQVLLPSDHLLDLKKLCDDKGRDLIAISPEAYQDLAHSQGLEALPAMPLNDGIMLIVATQLFKPSDLYLEVGNSGQYLKLSQTEFAKLVQLGDQRHFCVPISQLQQEADDRSAIESSVQQFTKLRIKRRLEETLEMPPLPDTAEQIIQLRINPDAGVGDLSELVEKDPSLAAQVVSWASSPYYAAPGAIRSVHDAVVRVLGFDLVINLALGLALGKSLELPKDGPHGVTPFWQQSVYTAAMMEGLVKAMPADHRPSLGLAYLSGLLSNYGYLVLAHIFPPYFKAINRSIEANPHLDSFYIERHMISVDRETLSSQLMECWNMPEEVVTALRWQNHPEYQGDHESYANLLYLSHQLLRNGELVLGPIHSVETAFYDRLGIDPQDALAVLNQVIERKDDLIQIAKHLG